MHFSLEECLSFVEKITPHHELYFQLYGKYSEDQRIVGLEGTFGDSLVQSRCSSRVNYCRLLWSMTSEVLIISKDGDSMHSLVNVLHCSTTLTLKKK